jgi:hypothetical protein
MMISTIKNNAASLIIGMALGFAGAEATIIRTVTKQAVDIDYLHQTDSQIRADFSDERKRTDERVNQLALLIHDAINQNQQLVEVLQVQNKLLERMRP